MVPVINRDVSGSFRTTRWSVVAAASAQDAPQAKVALSELCEQYWYPLYVFVRRRGFDVEEAQDITQGFFTRILEKQDFAAADRDKGKFRTFLLTCIQNYISNERDRSRAGKRGGGIEFIPLDFTTAEKQYALEPSHEETPEKAFVRSWVLALLERVLHELEEEFAAEGKTRMFQNLKPFLVPGFEDTPYKTLATQLKMSESALRVAVHRMRTRYRALLVRHVADTVVDPAQVAEEIAFLIESVTPGKK